MEIQELIEQLRSDSKAYHFCEEGQDGAMMAMSVEQCVKLLRENIVYCFDSEYHQAVADNIEKWYKQWKPIFNNQGIWVNEHAEEEKGLIIWTGYDSFHAVGNERVFRFGKSRYAIILLTDHARIYSKSHINIILAGYSHGFIYNACEVFALGHSTCYVEKSKVRSSENCRLFLTPDCNWIGQKGCKIFEEIQHVGF